MPAPKKPVTRTTLRLPEALVAQLNKDASASTNAPFVMSAAICAVTDAFIASRKRGVKIGQLNRALKTKSHDDILSFCAHPALMKHYRESAKSRGLSLGALVANALAQHYVGIRRITLS